jgi:hypothetical protein
MFKDSIPFTVTKGNGQIFTNTIKTENTAIYKYCNAALKMLAASFTK